MHLLARKLGKYLLKLLTKANLANVCQADFEDFEHFENRKRVTLTRPAIADR